MRRSFVWDSRRSAPYANEKMVSQSSSPSDSSMSADLTLLACSVVRTKYIYYHFHEPYQVYLQEVQAKLLSQGCPSFGGASQPGIEVCTSTFVPSFGIVELAIVDQISKERRYEVNGKDEGATGAVCGCWKGFRRKQIPDNSPNNVGLCSVITGDWRWRGS